MGLKARKDAKKVTTPVEDAAAAALLERVRVAIGPRADVREQRMFGGLCFMVGGHMTVGVSGARLMARVGAEGYADALAQIGARPMDFTGRPMNGFVWVDGEGTSTQAAVRKWLERCLKYLESLPSRSI